MPDYERNLDHGLIGTLGQAAFGARPGDLRPQRRQLPWNQARIGPARYYIRLDLLPRGALETAAIPTACMALTVGFADGRAQTWMVPPKYDVIHYIREAYLKPGSSDRYAWRVDRRYLDQFPGRGNEPWDCRRRRSTLTVMDYGPSLAYYAGSQR